MASIEGSLIIIAACIPILQPLLEMIKGRNIWSTNKSGSESRDYHKYGSGSARQQDPFELRSRPRKKVDVHGFTIHDKEESEESIVDRDAPIGHASSGRRSESNHPNEGGIMKTNDVTVTYEQAGEGPALRPRRWDAV